MNRPVPLCRGEALLRRAALALPKCTDRPPTRDELAAALRQVWLASGSWAEWPPELKATAEGVVALAFRDGTIRDTVDAMPEPELQQAAGLIRRIAAAAKVLIDPKPDRP